MPLHVAFLWHMHQPHYVDRRRGVALMPWARMHATKGYLDMIWLVEQYPKFRCTFNLTPVLLRQIEMLAKHEVRDLWHELAVTPASDLTLEQKCALLEHYFKANWDNMIKPFGRYWALLQKRGLKFDPDEIPRIAARFSEQEYRDLQVWFHLTWFGYTAQHLHPEIAELKQKGRDFSEDDKATVFRCQQQILQNVIARYKAAADRGQVEISTTPFYHPILPLVWNSEFARRPMPGCRLPPTFSHPEDVRAQLEEAREYHRTVFGVPPHGLWPSEGSVCPELIPVLKELNFEWMVTDEEILWRSMASENPTARFERNQLFHGFNVEHDGASVFAVFRERMLSDFIGFTASRNPPQAAAELIVRQLDEIARLHTTGEDQICAIVLDGENAWEYFPDGGEAFLRALYEEIASRHHLKTTTFHEYFTEHPPRTTLRKLYTGSWINADFHIWIGDEEDNRAWQLLGETRNFLQAQINQGNMDPSLSRKTLAEIHAAEGSDWFWWYGDQFVTEDDLLFDELFRTHLQNVYRFLDAPVPDALKVPICRSETRYESRQPSDILAPVIDGKQTSFYEWSGAGIYEPSRTMSAMYQSERIVEVLRYGFDLQNFYLCLEFRRLPSATDGITVCLCFEQPIRRIVEIAPLGEEGKRITLKAPATTEPQTDLICPSGAEFAFGEILEIKLPFDVLGFQPSDSVTFLVQLLSGGVEMERHPSAGLLRFQVPTAGFQLANWRI